MQPVISTPVPIRGSVGDILSAVRPRDIVSEILHELHKFVFRFRFCHNRIDCSDQSHLPTHHAIHGSVLSRTHVFCFLFLLRRVEPQMLAAQLANMIQRTPRKMG